MDCRRITATQVCRWLLRGRATMDIDSGGARGKSTRAAGGGDWSGAGEGARTRRDTSWQRLAFRRGHPRAPLKTKERIMLCCGAPPTRFQAARMLGWMDMHVFLSTLLFSARIRMFFLPFFRLLVHFSGVKIRISKASFLDQRMCPSFNALVEEVNLKLCRNSNQQIAPLIK